MRHSSPCDAVALASTCGAARYVLRVRPDARLDGHRKTVDALVAYNAGKTTLTQLSEELGGPSQVDVMLLARNVALRSSYEVAVRFLRELSNASSRAEQRLVLMAPDDQGNGAGHVLFANRRLSSDAVLELADLVDEACDRDDGWLTSRNRAGRTAFGVHAKHRGGTRGQKKRAKGKLRRTVACRRYHEIEYKQFCQRVDDYEDKMFWQEVQARDEEALDRRLGLL